MCVTTESSSIKHVARKKAADERKWIESWRGGARREEGCIRGRGGGGPSGAFLKSARRVSGSTSSVFEIEPLCPSAGLTGCVCVCAREISYMLAARAENSICDIRLLARARPTRTRARRARNRFRAMPVEEFAGKPRAEETNFSAFFRRVPKKICCLAWEKKGRRVSGVKNFTELREKLTLMLRLTGRKNIPLYPRYNTYAGVCLDSGWRSSHVVTCQQRIYIFLIGQWYYCS